MKTSDGISQEQYEKLGGKIEMLLNDYATALQNDDALLQYLRANPFPENEGEFSESRRRYFLLLNRVKNWVAREQGRQDGGAAWKKKFKKNPTSFCRLCQLCNKELRDGEKIEFHHTVRDGRKPIPVHKRCHESLNKKII